ncbi:M42 family metallopeptidase [Mycoplasma iguanae]|uniref:M42 family metallopeptidase n=1 Tax=Mycoplasma iguanae TaxID=292461 RepID=A0ABY5R995_9MOLU|nr:M42 family metallopeptidase [Mycoplasma iguanae]UVD81896.1 M42 family metallopeptidase [Mycoplasma iguanae]
MKNIDHEKIFSRLKEYMEVHGISRYEDEVVALIKKNTAQANVEYTRDGLGSLIMTKKSHNQGPKIMISVHMDEVGYIVLDILENGQLRVQSVGGVWPNVVVGSKAKVVTTTGKEYAGIFGHTSIHILEPEKAKKAVTNKDLFVDCGFDNKKIAVAAGVEIGDKIYIHGPTLRLYNKNLVAGKAMDNRAGITVLDFIINELSNETLPNQTYFVASVQEEVGTRGAKTSVSMINPDVAIAIDTTSSYDTYLSGTGENKLSKGVALRVADRGTLMDPKLIQYFKDLAQKHNIPLYKFVAQGGGTDAAELQFGRGGVATICLSIPQRYLHSPIGVCDLEDLKNNIVIVVEFLKSFDQTALDSIKYK